jgi:L-threonylcarbamoyladenylate synthase
MLTNRPLTTSTRPYGAAAIGEAARAILAGDIVAMPTETVYGLAGDATNARAVAAIYAAKQRPAANPLIVHVADRDAAMRLGHFDARACALADAHWPGPLTLVVPLRGEAGLAAAVPGGQATVAVRVPAHPAMRALIIACARPLAAPSANASGRISPTRAAHVAATLTGRIALIVDGGATARGIESTIVAALPGEPLRTLRAGPLAIADPAAGDQPTPPTPGSAPSHYAPRKPLRLDVVQPRAGEFHIGFGGLAGDVSLSTAGDLAEAAAALFAALHDADASPTSAIAVAPIPAVGIGIAINDRLSRAAHA